MKSITRRTALAAVSSLALMPRKIAFAADAPIRIGFMTIKTGPIAQAGIQAEQGMRIFLKERSYQLAGRKVDLLVVDTGGSPATTRTKVQELVERDKIDFLMGPVAAFEAIAINDYIASVGVPTLASAGSEDLTMRKAN